MPHRNPRYRNFAPRFRRPNESIDLTWQFNSGPLAKTESANVFVEPLFAHTQRKLGRADVARLHQNIADAQIRKRAMIMEGAASEIPEAVLAKDRRIGAKLAFVKSSGGGNDLERRAWLHHVDDGPVFHFFSLRFRAKIQVKIRSIGHCQDFAG